FNILPLAVVQSSGCFKTEMLFRFPVDTQCFKLPAINKTLLKAISFHMRVVRTLPALPQGFQCLFMFCRG
ncbi:hypothetical protein, partial [Enterobacter hormaechei]|uniref:hypothetical protein n=1 Tax=Enterobacter hormaechei TaxID=158836 RepID=UPI0028743633